MYLPVVSRWVQCGLVAGILFAAMRAARAGEAYDAWWPEAGEGLVQAGADRSEAEAAFRRIQSLDLTAAGVGSWSYELALPGYVHHRRAQERETTGDSAGAIAEYRQASAFFDAARFPALTTPERSSAYKKHLECYLKLASLNHVPLRIVSIPFEGKQIVGHLHLPEAERPPLLIWSGGLDGWKTAGLDFKQRLLDEGFAVFAVDLPGTGESQWPLEADSDRIYSRIIEYFRDSPEVDGQRVAVYFGSFSGVYAIKLSLVDPRLKAAVNHSGGIHLFFHPQATQLPPLTTSVGMRAAATMHAMGVADKPLPEALAHFGTFSLKDQGLLKATPNQAPLLSIYGTKDILMPIEDFELLKRSGVKSDELIYEGDGHMAWEHADDHRPKMIAWLKKHLEAQP
jgi:esterase FrsA